MKKTNKNKEIKKKFPCTRVGPKRLELYPDPLKTQFAEVALQKGTRKKRVQKTILLET